MYRTVHFRYASSSEWKFDERGEPVTPGGRALAVQIARAIEPEAACTSEVCQHEYYGWGFHSSFAERAFYQVINAADREVYLTIEMQWYFVNRLLLRKPRAVFERYCRIVSAALASTDGVSDVAWEPSS